MTTLIDLTPYFARPGSSPFTDRRATMPFRNSMPIPAEEIESTWQTLQQQILPPRKRLVYIHIPFCATHCLFCGFYQNRLNDDSTKIYTTHLLKELSMEADSPLHQSAPIHAVYFGGGTPTALSANELYLIISTLREKLPLAPDCEITIEGRILNFDDARIDACLDAGANRFSIGIQTFDSKIRKKMARIADKHQAIRFMENLCSRNRAAVVCDLMFGLPGQNEQTWAEDLNIVNQLPLDGVDLYALNLLSNTPLMKAVENNRMEIIDVVDRFNFYLQGTDFLADEGWHQLSNSHWGKTTRERNLYNLLIKQNTDYLALGSGAGGSINDHAYMMQRDLNTYYQTIEQGRKPIAMMTRPNGQKNPYLSIIQAGIEVGYLKLDTILDDCSILQPLLSQWHQTGLLVDDNPQRLRLTTAGRYWASNLMRALQDIVTKLKFPHAMPPQMPSHPPHGHKPAAKMHQ